MPFSLLSRIFHGYLINVSVGPWWPSRCRPHSNPSACTANAAFLGIKQSNTCVVCNSGSWSRWRPAERTSWLPPALGRRPDVGTAGLLRGGCGMAGPCCCVASGDREVRSGLFEIRGKEPRGLREAEQPCKGVHAPVPGTCR